MKRVVATGVVLLLAGCAGQPYPAVPVEEKGYGVPQAPAPAYEPAKAPHRDSSVSSEPTISPALPSATPSTPSAAPIPNIAPKAVQPPQSRKYAGPAPVLLALMEQADGYESRGDLQGALAQLERAQRIAPRDPMVYLQLARLRLQMNDRARAEQLARRGLSLSAGDRDLVAAFNALLVELSR